MKYLAIAGLFIGGIFLIALLITIPTWLLWNWLMPTLFDLKRITIMQAWGLVMLCGLLFKSTNTTTNKE